MKKTVLITREPNQPNQPNQLNQLNRKGYFYKTLTQEGFTVSGISFISIIPLKFTLPQHFNWIFFSSPTGVKQFFATISANQVMDKKLACLGVGTENELKKLNLSPNFVGTSEVQNVGFEFAKKAQSEIVLFPGAEKSKRSIQKSLASENVVDLATYKTLIKELKITESYEIIIFTSPSNVRGYLQSGNLILKSQKIIAIGKSTEKELREKGIFAFVSNGYLEEDWVKAVLND